MQKYIVYFILRSPNRAGGQKVNKTTGCISGDCYLCPFEGCSRIGGDVRAKATPAALSYLRQKRPNSVIVKKIMTEEEARKKWQL